MTKFHVEWTARFEDGVNLHDAVKSEHVEQDGIARPDGPTDTLRIPPDGRPFDAKASHKGGQQHPRTELLWEGHPDLDGKLDRRFREIRLGDLHYDLPPEGADDLGEDEPLH